MSYAQYEEYRHKYVDNLNYIELNDEENEKK